MEKLTRMVDRVEERKLRTQRSNRTEPNRDKRFKNMKEEVERQEARLQNSKIGLMGATREAGA